MKILICLYKTLGDVVLGSTLIAELKKKYPDAEITFAVQREYVELIDTNPDVKGLIITDDHDVVLAEATSGRYDQVLFPAQLTHTDTCWHHRDKYKNGHLVDFYAKRCGLEISERRTYMFPSEADMEKANGIVDRVEGRKNIVIHTTTLCSSKDWHLFGELAEALRKEYENPLIIQVGGPDDTKCGVGLDLRGKLTYNEIAALCSMTDMFIGVDSGLAYIADSVECPIILMMGMSTSKTSGPISGRVDFIEPQRPEGCEWPCHTNCKHETPCIRTITVEEVLNHVREKIGGEEEGKGGVHIEVGIEEGPGTGEEAGAKEGGEA